MAEPRRTGVLVAGAGPAGVTAAIQCRRLGLGVLLAESSGLAGGLLREARRVENLPLLDEPVAGAELARRLAANLRRYGIEAEPWRVLSVSPGPRGGFLSETSGGPVESGAVILATGTRPADFELPGDPRRILRSFLDLPAPLAGRTIAVIGGGEAAFDYALHASDRGAAVELMVRGPAPRAAGCLVEEAAGRPSIRIRYVTRVLEVLAAGPRTVLGLLSGDTETSLPCDAVLAAVGRERLLPDVSRELRISDGGSVEPSIPGLYLAGDASTGVLGQAGSAVGQGLTAAAEAARHLRGGEQRPC